MSNRNARVLIIGAGPVGLTLAIALGEAGFHPTILEKRRSLRPHSRAIGITPASLEIFDRYGLAEELVAAGVPVPGAVIHGDTAPLGEADFGAIPSRFPFILSLPQRRTEEILLRRFLEAGNGELLRGMELTGLSLRESGATAVARETAASGDATGGGPEHRLAADFIIGCDGKHSTLRELAGLGGRGHELADTFLMGDLRDETGLGATAHLYFTSRGSVESFPLPGEIRRWIVQTDRWYPEPPPGLLQEGVLERTGISLGGSEELWRSSFRTERREAAGWAKPPIFLAGDAAHLMPPIGGQGMNVGIADAEFLADLITGVSAEPGSLGRLAEEYERRRRHAFRVAARRSILGMKTGTARGRIPGGVRDAAVAALLNSPLRRRLMEHFAMIAAPERRSPWRSAG